MSSSQGEEIADQGAWIHTRNTSARSDSHSLSRALWTRLATLAFLLLTAGALGVASPAVAAPTCAQTDNPSGPVTPVAGSPCWTDVTPYPFGIDGNPVDPTSPLCAAGPQGCYLQVTSMAFRAWNRGLAALEPLPAPSGAAPPTPYTVWLFNGTRWYPDPTFPGPSACPGNTVLWAGKLDYWLVGQGLGASGWPNLCRFDGVNFEWEPLAVPKATIAQAGTVGGAITAGACLAWNNCWFFGTAGVVVHWDGQSLTNVTMGLGLSPWLRASYTAAIARTDTAGNPFAFAVADAAPLGETPQPQPNGSPAPQLFESTGGSVDPLSLSPSALLGAGSETDLVAVDFDAEGEGWVAGNPAEPPGAAPLVPLSASGAALSCPATPPTSFVDSGVAGGWSSIGVVPGGGAIAGGPASSSFLLGPEPVLAQVSCTNPPQLTRFRVPDPNNPSGPPVPADVGGYITAVAVNAVNDAWASSSQGLLPGGITYQPPHLYRLTDGQPPLAPAGDDNESRPVAVVQQPSVFVIAPPVVIPPPPAPTTVTTSTKPKHRTVKLPSPIYDVQAPRLVRGHNGTYSLVITFKVRRKVRIGLEALRGGRVVSSTGLRTFTGKTGVFVLSVDPKHWPTKLKFILPRARR